jgi:acetylornithine deacetylase
MEEKEQLILSKVDAMRDEIVAVLSQLVRIPSVSPNYPELDKEKFLGGESRCNAALAEHFRGIGCEVDMWEVQPQRANLVGVLKGTGGGRSLIFNGHIDTVPPGPHEDWMWNDPYSGNAQDGNLYGLGSCDMKGGIVAQFAAAKALVETGISLKGDLILESVVGEESMDHEAGTTATVRRGYKADAAIVSEPSSYPYPLTIAPASPGLLYLVVNVSGRATHPGIRAEFVRAGGAGDKVGVNAVEKGALILSAIQRLEQIWGISKKHAFFRPGYFTIHPGVIIGGPPGPLVPYIVSTYCRIECIIWYPPHEAVEDVKAEIEDYLQTAAKLDPWLAKNPPAIEWRNHWPPFETDPDHPIIQTCVNAYEQASAGASGFRKEAYIHGFAAVCDATFLNREGIPTIVYGPGDILVAHTRNEFVPVDEVIMAAKTYALAALNWCGAG